MLALNFPEKLSFLIYQPVEYRILRNRIFFTGIYCITNILNGKFYIGSSKNCDSRWLLHKHHLRHNRHDNRHLQRAWNKYGEEAFEFDILELCAKDKLILEQREQYWIDLTDCCNRLIGYNLAPIANNQLGTKRSQETKDKISASRTGIKVVFSYEHKINLSKAAKGKIRSPEHAENLRKAILLRCRDVTNWPHELGAKCRCKDCTDKRAVNQKNRRLAKLNGD